MVDPQLLANSKRADFVTYIPNPHFRKGAPFGAATRAVAAQRAARLRLAADRPDRCASCAATEAYSPISCRCRDANTTKAGRWPAISLVQSC